MEFIRAYFGNNERTVVKAFYLNDDGSEVPYVISAEDGNPQWKKLLKHITIDDLHEATYKHIREAEENYKSQVMSIAKERGMLLDIDAANADSMKALLQIVFEESDNEKEAKEKLFAFKLALFELDAIRESENRDLKGQLRKAVTIMDALSLGISIVKQNQT